jgi:hypothetical protein
VRRYRRDRRDGESFSDLVARLSDGELASFAAKPPTAAMAPAPAAIAEPRAS